MKAKLIKDHTDYHIVNEEQFVIGTTDKGMLNCTDKHKLSLKNCQSIERGYDLDELAREMTDKEHQLATQYSKGYEKGIVVGFQKALELMGDKKYSEEDMTRIFEYGWNQRHFERMDETQLIEIKNGFIQSLQQTEWDVEIEMDAIPADRAPGGWDRFPKLDADGCLILKPLPKE
jgi:hypothetical protein